VLLARGRRGEGVRNRLCYKKDKKKDCIIRSKVVSEKQKDPRINLPWEHPGQRNGGAGGTKLLNFLTSLGACNCPMGKVKGGEQGGGRFQKQ